LANLGSFYTRNKSLGSKALLSSQSTPKTVTLFHKNSCITASIFANLCE
jgi:hypothetical protein